MRSKAMRRRIHRTLCKKLSGIYAVNVKEILSWITYISVAIVIQCICIVMMSEQRGGTALGGEYLIVPAAILARLWIPEMIHEMAEILEAQDEEEEDV